MAIVSASGKFSKQHTSYPKSRCTHRSGLEWHNFTGEPFQTDYNPQSCSVLCYARYVHKECGCHGTVGWNITRSNCTENPEMLNCIKFFSQNISFVKSQTANCFSSCYPKCNQKSFRTKVFKTRHTLWFRDSVSTLETLEQAFGGSKPFRRFSEKLQNNATNQTEVEEIMKNIAELNFYFSLKEKWVEMETIAKMSFSTFFSNLGGLVGMWLGISAVTIAEMCEKLAVLIGKLRTKRKCHPNDNR